MTFNVINVRSFASFFFGRIEIVRFPTTLSVYTDIVRECDSGC